MKLKNNDHHETIERYCHVIGSNTTVTRTIDSKGESFECMNKRECEKNGGCKNCRFTGTNHSE